MRFGPRVALLSIVLLLAAGVSAAAGVPGATGPDGDRSERHALQEEPRIAQEPRIAPTSMNLTLQLRADGHARWTVETAFRLETEEDRRAFDSLAEQFRDGDADTTYDVETFDRASSTASEATGREMQITDVDRSVGRQSKSNYTVGHLRTSFTWTNFSTINGQWLTAGDAFNTTNGTWLPGLAADQRLVVRPPPGYSAYDVPIAPQQAQFVWQGPASFEPGDLTMTFRYTGRTGTGSSTAGTPFDPATLGLFAAIVVALGALALGGYAWAHDEDLPDGPVVAGGDASGAAEESGTDAPDESGATAGGAAGAAAVAGEADEEEAEGVDLDLLSDEERVEYLLEENGGRMKQANIVKETGWSNAKVSQLLSAMDEADRVDKLRIGRENLISLPDEEIGEFDR